MAQTLERKLLDLANPLPGDTQLRADALQRHRRLAVQTEVQTEDLGLPGSERAHRLLDPGTHRRLHRGGIALAPFRWQVVHQAPVIGRVRGARPSDRWA